MLYDHQKKIIADDPKKCGLFLGTGGGKTRTALSLASGNTLVVMPKTQKLDGNWERELSKMRIDGMKDKVSKMTCLSKEEFKKVQAILPTVYDTVIFDEAHTVCGVTPTIHTRDRKPVPKASQIFEAAYSFLQRTNPERVYLCTATPARNPMAVWAAATLLGHELSWHNWRKSYYIKLPMPGREVWMPRKDKEPMDDLAKAVASIGYVGRLSDWFDVPDQTDKYIHCPLTKDEQKLIDELPLIYPDPLALIGKTHQAEQASAKLSAIEDLLEEFPKVVIFARYLAQIDEIDNFLKARKIKTFIMTGATKDRKEVIAGAEASDRCAFIAQAQVSTGYELPSFRCLIFASMDYSMVNYTQARGRILRANALNRNLYVHLHSGEIDDAVIKCMKGHSNFSEKVYAEAKTAKTHAETGSQIPNTVQRISPRPKAHRNLRIEADDEGLDPF